MTLHRRCCVLAALLALAAPAGAELNCSPGIDFDDDGRVRGCVLNGNHRVYTDTGVAVNCADGRYLEQHPDGNLKRCTLVQPLREAQQECPAGSEATFAADGRMSRCTRQPS